MENSTERKVFYALISFVLGVWAFIKTNTIAGPTFEPIIEACTNPDISLEDFASKTGYHEYDARVGLGALNGLVCLITQFLLQLRETYPAGLLVWGGLVVIAFPLTVVTTIEGGRKGAFGPIRYTVTMGVVYQMIGVSVGFLMIWIPSFVLGEGKRGTPVSSLRILTAALTTILSLVLSVLVFVASTDSQLWTTSAGILGGPIIAMLGLVLFLDSPVAATQDNAKKCSAAIRNVHKLMIPVGFVSWYVLVAIAYQEYRTDLGALWDAIWTSTNASVQFMTIDTGVLIAAFILYVAYRGGEAKGAKALLLSTVLGPAAACCYVLSEVEDETELAVEDQEDVKKD